MRLRRQHRSRLVLALAAAALAVPLLSAGVAQAARVSCELVATGPAGAAGDVLRVVDSSRSVTHIYRSGDAIAVANNADRDPAVCAGGAPTVFNVDRIEYSTATGEPFINYSGDGPLAPGASAEAGAAAIEIVVEESYSPKVVNVAGTAAGESIQIGQLGRGAVGVNLDAQADGAHRDPEVTIAVPPGDGINLRVLAKGGDDTLSARGGSPFTAPLESAERLVMTGGPGDDTLMGGPFRDFLSGDDGNDRLFGGSGRDKLLIGPGRDHADGGSGGDEIENRSDVGAIAEDLFPDRILGGAGDDSVSVAQGLAGDRVDCGAGRDDGAYADAGDRTRACENVNTRGAGLDE